MPVFTPKRRFQIPSAILSIMPLAILHILFSFELQDMHDRKRHDRQDDGRYIDTYSKKIIGLKIKVFDSLGLTPFSIFTFLKGNYINGQHIRYE